MTPGAFSGRLASGEGLRAGSLGCHRHSPLGEAALEPARLAASRQALRSALAPLGGPGGKAFHFSLGDLSKCFPALSFCDFKISRAQWPGFGRGTRRRNAQGRDQVRSRNWTQNSRLRKRLGAWGGQLGFHCDRKSSPGKLFNASIF